MKSRYLFIYSLKSFSDSPQKNGLQKKIQYVNSPDFKTWPTHTYVAICVSSFWELSLFFASPKKMLDMHFFPKKNTDAGRWRMKFTYKLKLKYLSSSVMFLSEVDFWKIRFFESLFFGSVFFLGRSHQWINLIWIQKVSNVIHHISETFGPRSALSKLVCYSCPSRLRGLWCLEFLVDRKDLPEDPWQIRRYEFIATESLDSMRTRKLEILWWGSGNE